MGSDPLAGYLLVKKALSCLSSATHLGYTANAERKDGEIGDEDHESSAMVQLSEAVSALKGGVPFAVGGRIELCDSDRNTSLVILQSAHEVAGVLEKVDAAALMPHCTKATFGDSRERTNREDPSVRVALELAAGAWELRAPGGGAPRFLEAVRDRVQAALLDSGRVVELVPQKINAYEAGGHFAEHVDTPTDAQHMVGTLLVCLPCSHSGGALVVKHNAEEVRFDFAAESGVTRASTAPRASPPEGRVRHTRDIQAAVGGGFIIQLENARMSGRHGVYSRGGAIQWAALYSDCLHNVETVTSGCRVTVSYSILARKGHPTAHGHGTPSSCLADHLTHAAWPPATAPLLSAVAGRLEALRDDASRPQSAVGMYLNHMYTSAALNPAGLKGADRMLYTHVAEKWGVTLMHVVEKVHEKAENSDDERAPEDFESEYDNQVFAFSAPDLDRLASGARGPAPGCEGLQDVAFVKPWSAKMVLQETTHRTAGGNQGNWYENGSKEIDSLYLHAALIVRLDQPALPT